MWTKRPKPSGVLKMKVKQCNICEGEMKNIGKTEIQAIIFERK